MPSIDFFNILAQKAVDLLLEGPVYRSLCERKNLKEDLSTAPNSAAGRKFSSARRAFCRGLKAFFFWPYGFVLKAFQKGQHSTFPPEIQFINIYTIILRMSIAAKECEVTLCYCTMLKQYDILSAINCLFCYMLLLYSARACWYFVCNWLFFHIWVYFSLYSDHQ